MIQTKIYSLIFLVAYLLPATHWARAEAVDESWKQVIHFQLKLAEQGNANAQYMLGEMYEEGRGVDQSFTIATEWYKKAAKNGHKEAAKRITGIQEKLKQAEQEKLRLAVEKARQLELQKKQQEEEAAAEQQRQQALEKARAEETARKKAEQEKLSPEERARRIKEAQEKAQAIAKQNQLRQQQEMDAQLKRLRSTTGKSSKEEATKNKYQNPFE